MHCYRTHGMGMHVGNALVHTCGFARMRWRALTDVITSVGRHVSSCSLVRWQVLMYLLAQCITRVCRRCQMARQVGLRQVQFYSSEVVEFRESRKSLDQY